ncbi:MAG: hypothetical protein WA655_05855 [Candidatus Korobacteraceae bacterium]
MPAPSGREGRAYKPGQIVPISGVYTVVHERHREQHEVVAIRGDEFPACRVCKADVRFYVARVVPHVTHDFDLTGPGPAVLKARGKAASEDSG